LTAGANVVPTLHLITGADVVDGTATEQTDLKVTSLAIEAVTGIGSADDLDIAVSNLAAANSGAAASGNIQISNTGALTLPAGPTGVDGVVGVTRSGGGLGNIVLVAASPLTVNALVTDSTGGDITLTAGAANSNSAADVLTLNANAMATGGNGSIPLSGNSLVVNTATVSAVGTGNVTANFGGTGGAATFNNGSTVSAVDGLIDVMATTSVTLNGNATIQTSGTGNIRFTTDDVAIAATATINANTNNVVTLRNFTTGRQINLGTNTTLGLTDSELDRISAGTLCIGRNDASASGTITVSALIDLTAGAFTIPTLHLITGADVVETGPGALTATGLAVEAGTNIALDTNPSTVQNFAASSTTGSIAYRDSNGFTVTTVDGVIGVTTTNQPITLCTDTGDLSLAQAVNAGSTGVVRLQANTGNIAQAATGIISGGTLGVRAGGNIVLDTTSNQLTSDGIFAALAGGSVSFRNANGFTIGTVMALGCFTMPVTDVTAGGNVTLCVDTGDLSIASPINVGANPLLRLQATSGNVTQTPTGTITAGTLGVRAGGSVMLTAAANNVDTFAAAATGSVEFKDTTALTIGTVTASGCFTPTATGITTAGN